MRVLIFLLQTVFFVLVASALMRAWMNGLRVRMTQQPGPFVMALSNWLVMPLRRLMPRALMSSSVDWASLLAAVFLCGLYGLLAGVVLSPISWWHWTTADWVGWLWLSGQFLCRTALQGAMVLAFVYALVSWVQPHSPVYASLAHLLDPLLRPIRRVIPLVGGVDLSVLALLVLLQVGLMLLG